MSSFLPEAQLMAEYVKERPGNVIAEVEFLDQYPEYRWTLECLTGAPNGNLFDEVPNWTGGDKLPPHFYRERGYYLSKVKDSVAVQGLLEALLCFYRSPGASARSGLWKAREWFQKKAERFNGDYAKALEVMTEYFQELADSMPEFKPDNAKSFGNQEVGVKDVSFATLLPVGKNFNLSVDETEEYYGGAVTRQVLVHSPNGDIGRDWLDRQPAAWKCIFFGIRKTKTLKVLSAMCKKIRVAQETVGKGGRKFYSGVQINVLWSMYFGKRDMLRRKQEHNAERNMSELGDFLLKRIAGQTEAYAIGRVGSCLYSWSKGERYGSKPLPCSLTPGEWSVIWNAYKAKKAELDAQQAEFDALSI